MSISKETYSTAPLDFRILYPTRPLNAPLKIFAAGRHRHGLCILARVLGNSDAGQTRTSGTIQRQSVLSLG